MLRGIGRILLLLMIVIMASGSPLYFDRIDAETFWERASDNGPEDLPLEEDRPVEVSVDYRFQEGEAGSYDLYVDLMILQGEILFEEDLIALDILIEQETLHTLEFSSVSPEYSEGDSLTGESVEFRFSIDREALALSDGEYDLRLKTETAELSKVEEESFQIVFKREFDYTPSMLGSQRGRIPLILYFPTEMADYSVPVTRFITTSDRRLVQAALGLERGPAEHLGLISGDDYEFPSWGHISFQQGRTSVSIQGDYGYFDDPERWPPIYRAFVYSFLSTPGVSASDHQFYFNQQVRNDAFGGMQLDEPVGFPEGPRIYFGYTSSTDHGLLVPAFLSEEASFESVMDFFNDDGELLNPEGFYQLHQLIGNPGFYTHRKLPVVPQGLYPEELFIEDNIAHLIFSETSIEDLKDEQIFMMMDGLLKGYLQFSNIEAVIISMEDGQEDALFHYPLDTPISEPVFINIENP